MKPTRSLNKSIVLILALCLTGMLVLTGCGSGGSSASSDTGTSSEENAAVEEFLADWSMEMDDLNLEIDDYISMIMSGLRMLDDYDSENTESTEEVTEEYLDDTTTTVDARPITMIFGGDVMLARGVESVINKAGDGDYTFPWLNVADYLKGADITFVNLESIISDQGSIDWTKLVGPWFRADPEAVEGLQYAGVDVVSVANNHCFDYGKTGLQDSLANLTAAGIKYTGAGTYEEAYTPAFVTAKGKTVAFLAYTNQVFRSSYPSVSQVAAEAYTDSWGIQWPASWGAAWLNFNMIDKGIANAKAAGADIIVVSMHFGTEYSTTSSKSQKEFAQYAMNQGADLVIGHGPHVTQPLVVWTASGGVKYVAYSLGNLIFDQYERLHSGVSKGMLLEVTWQSGAIQSIVPRYVKINQTTWQPEPDSSTGE
jgi:poly-gamma-glutamate synthesis protein (capsule biosynthesis protein)